MRQKGIEEGGISGLSYPFEGAKMGSMLPLDKREQAGLGVSSGSGYSGPAVTITGNFVCANTPSAALQVVLFKAI